MEQNYRDELYQRILMRKRWTMTSQPVEIAIPKNKHPLIASTKFGVMSTIRHSDGMISSNPVGYFWDGEIIRISTLKSRVKYQNLLADSRVALHCQCRQRHGLYRNPRPRHAGG
ncbi:MAG: pyridoxamine 5'-phosphate oxidase family protein [Gammaproteobacteria bacterium]|nr:pyridoxamine 5'-phosphate oxidase family protein [Gammaproteobacteria bacterium]